MASGVRKSLGAVSNWLTRVQTIKHCCGFFGKRSYALEFDFLRRRVPGRISTEGGTAQGAGQTQHYYTKEMTSCVQTRAK